jgi:branched-chain amino acid transport system substrate-binding protein
MTAGNIDRQAVRDAFANIRQFKGVTGDISFTPDSRDPVKGAVILQIKDGAFVWFAAAGS